MKNEIDALVARLAWATELLNTWGHDPDCRRYRARRLGGPETPCDCNLEDFFESLQETRTLVESLQVQSPLKMEDCIPTTRTIPLGRP